MGKNKTKKGIEETIADDKALADLEYALRNQPASECVNIGGNNGVTMSRSMLRGIVDWITSINCSV